MGKFLRVFDNSNHKIYAGRLSGVTDSSFFITKNKNKTEVKVSEVNRIKFGRAAGHPILIAGGVSAVGIAIAGAAAGEQPVNDGSIEGNLHDTFLLTPGEGAAYGFLLGAAAGSVVGTIIAAAKKKHVFTINNDIKEWAKLKGSLNQSQRKFQQIAPYHPLCLTASYRMIPVATLTLRESKSPGMGMANFSSQTFISAG